MTDHRNTILAVVLSLVILIGWEMFFAPKLAPPPVAEGVPITEATPAPGAVQTPEGLTAAVAAPDRASALASDARLRISTPHLHGSLSLTGARFDDITLIQYRETPDPASPEIVLLSPQTAPKPYYTELGWIGADPGVKLPGANAVWTPADPNAELTETTPVVLTWDNGEGLRFTRTIRADKDYLFTVEQTVENSAATPVTLYPYGLVARIDTPPTLNFFILHEGPLGVFDRTLQELKYDDLVEEQRVEAKSSEGGWIGITDKYWLVTVAFDQTMPITGSYNHSTPGGRDRYQSDLRGDAITLAPGETKAVTAYVFAGAKQVELLDAYAETPGIARFDLAIDFGWFYFLTKPFFYGLNALKELLGNFGLAILGFTVVIRLIMFPLANKQFAAMSKLKLLQPEMKKLQERYGTDRVKLNQEMMELYKREKANPLAGCLPILVQIPVFFALYKVLFVSIEMRHAPFYGWIHDLSAPDPTSVFNLFGLLPYDVPSFLMIGAWPIIMGVTMYLQQKINPQPADPIQAKIMMLMPIIFTFLLGSFPAGLVIYWAWSNTLGIIQQWVIMRKMGVKV